MKPGLKYPPDGVETTPTSTDIVPLRDAARLLGRDHRTVQAMIIKGTLRGGAEPQAQRLRWYVYRQALPPPAHPPTSVGDSTAVIATQAAKIITLEHNNRVLLAAVDDLLEGFERYKAGAHNALEAARHFEAAAQKYADGVHGHREALAQHLTPGHLGPLDEDAGSPF